MSAAEPIWLAALRVAAQPPYGAAIARRVGYDPAVISRVLKGTYTGSLQAVQQAVESRLLQGRTDCPVLGDIAEVRCLENQRLPFAATNPTRVQLHATCPTCPHHAGATGQEKT